MRQTLNEIVRIDHLYVTVIRLIHCMDLVSRYSAVHTVKKSIMIEYTIGFESWWVSQFCNNKEIFGDVEYISEGFRKIS